LEPKDKKSKNGFLDKLEEITKFLNRFIFLIWDVVVVAALLAFTIKFITGIL
jgi:hypothetical protein